MRIKRSIAVLFFTCTLFATTGDLLVQAQTPAQRIYYMKVTNNAIEASVEVLDRRCEIQLDRKNALEEIAAAIKPELNKLNVDKEAIEVTLRAQTAVLVQKKTELTTVQVAIDGLLDQIKQFRKSNYERLLELRSQVAVAKKNEKDASAAIKAADAEFRKWEEEGANSFILTEALGLRAHDKPLTDIHKLALVVYDTYLIVAAEFGQKQINAAATIVLKEKEISDLLAGQKVSIEELGQKLAAKRRELVPAVTALNKAQNDVNKTDKELRFVLAKIAAISSFVIPEIHPICKQINPVVSPVKCYKVGC